ncbi:hypothetical protein VL14_16935 [Cytobacillus firmus]|nr:hypothetical protein VL14_16935 [Cytobacillus firmus]
MYAFPTMVFHEIWSFSFIQILGILSENSVTKIQKEMNEMTAKKYENKECMYCSGKGYFQLLLGGSETCSCCGGTGKKKE